MAATERGVVTQRATVLLLSLLRFMKMSNKGWEAQETQGFMVIVAVLTFLIANDKM